MTAEERIQAFEELNFLYLKFLKAKKAQKRYKLFAEIEDITYELLREEEVMKNIKKNLSDRYSRFKKLLP